MTAQDSSASGHANTKNKLYYGDNFDVIRDHIKDSSVDLIYLDPPFNSKRNYNVIFKDGEDQESEAQIQAFVDTWCWDSAAQKAYDELVKPDGKYNARVMALIELFKGFLGTSDLMAYLVMMSIRLVELHRVLKATGSLYLHCDPTASHYLKLILDAIFGQGCFRNEIIWRYRRWPARSRQLQKMHDVILFYSKSDSGDHTFNTLYGYESLAESTLKTFGTKKQVADFASGHRKPSTEDIDTEGPPLSDVWEIGIIAPISKERLGYPTQKPEALLERIILASSNENDIVLDPFCGCGTAIAVAENLGRRWIGIDITHLAIALIRNRINTAFPHRQDAYEVIGEPVDLSGAQELAESDRYQFQWWALSLVGARPVGDSGGSKSGKKGKDQGVDGVIFFRDDPKLPRNQKIIVSVKSGKVSPSHVRDLRGVIEREQARTGVLLTLQEPTKDMRTEAAAAGTWRSEVFNTEQSYARIQIITIEEALRHGKRPAFPGHDRTLKAAPRASARAEQPLLLPGVNDVPVPKTKKR